MHSLILPSLFLTALAATMPAGAETLSRSLDGTRLELRLSCVKSVAIDPEPGLAGKIEIVASAAAPDELDKLGFTGGAVAKIERKGDCPLHQDKPSLTLAIKVPPATPIDLEDAGPGDYKIGAVGAALKIDIAGSGDVEAADSTDLDLHIAGSGDVSLDRLNGPGKIAIRGSGDVTIGGGSMPNLAIELRGSGDTKISGEIGTLSASTVGSGDIQIDGGVKDAALSTFGSGDIEIAKATGSVKRSNTGSGTIKIGQQG